MQILIIMTETDGKVECHIQSGLEPGDAPRLNQYRNGIVHLLTKAIPKIGLMLGGKHVFTTNVPPSAN